MGTSGLLRLTGPVCKPGMLSTRAELAESVAQAFRCGEPVAIVGAGTKDFYGRTVTAKPLAVSGYRGVVAYEPTELVVTVRAGTPLTEVQSVLAGANQMLAFEPPGFGDAATIGGTVSCGLAGPRRPYAGTVRDFVLGVVCINGRGQVLQFGGQVMKNVAGFDVSRLMVGAMGTLGVLLEVSLKVLPKPAAESSLVFQLPVAEAVRLCNRWTRQALPVSAACYLDDKLYLRLSGAEAAVGAAEALLGGELLTGGDAFWQALREHQLPFFQRPDPLWRISVPPASPPLALAGDWLLDWGGAQRWLYSPADPAAICEIARASGGSATLFRGGERRGEVFMALPEPLLALQQRVKAAFDPRNILSPGRLYRAL